MVSYAWGGGGLCPLDCGTLGMEQRCNQRCCIWNGNMLLLSCHSLCPIREEFHYYLPEPEVQVNCYVYSFKYNELNGREGGAFGPPHYLTQPGVRHTLAMTVVCSKLRG